ncbi:hypothetical protein [Nonomuraea basaltis]|uniref:hypothetical protein n=1 Tax=Nonomuraea basaltis TaxID=2495887 RepID=UPI00110C5BE8|nr:hypothetical protein [Nonomuraea basaltis]TMR93848.1 hypothetical protein EJK15_36895 [Nonomuraea basaltis]
MGTARKLAPASLAAVLALTIAPAAQAQAQTVAAPVTASIAESGTLLHASRQDRAYLRQAHRGHLAEIAAGRFRDEQ